MDLKENYGENCHNFWTFIIWGKILLQENFNVWIRLRWRSAKGAFSQNYIVASEIILNVTDKSPQIKMMMQSVICIKLYRYFTRCIWFHCLFKSTIPNGDISVQLVASKAKVVPPQTPSIPWLESILGNKLALCVYFIEKKNIWTFGLIVWMSCCETENLVKT